MGWKYNYVAETQTNSKINSGFRITIEQIQDYKVNLSSTNSFTEEGSNGRSTQYSTLS